MSSLEYDSRGDTLEHIRVVARHLHQIAAELLLRADQHDDSKLRPPEKEAFDQVIPQLRGVPYGSDEYRAILRSIKSTINHHTYVNSHHHEHWDHGVTGMSLVDVIEMLCDWKAATLRQDDGDIATSIDMYEARGILTPQLAQILRNTADRMGWGRGSDT